jgi:hypothetical protein
LEDDAISEARARVPFLPVAEKENVDVQSLAHQEREDAPCDVDVHRIPFLVWVVSPDDS